MGEIWFLEVRLVTFYCSFVLHHYVTFANLESFMVVFFLIISSYVIALLRSILCGYFYVGGDSSALSTAGDQDIFSVPASILKGCPFT